MLVLSVPILFGWPETGLILKQVVAFGGAILATSLVIEVVTADGPGFLRAVRSASLASRRMARRYAGRVLRQVAVIGVLLLITKLVYRVPHLDITADVLWYTTFIVTGVVGALLVWSSYHRKPPEAKPLP